MFEGNLAQMNLAEVLKLLTASAQSGVLMLTEDGPVGSIYLYSGQAVHASYGPALGVDALMGICRHTHAGFSFEAGVAAPEQSLSSYPTDKLIEKLEGRIREFLEVEQSMPLASDLPRYVGGQSMGSIQATPDELSLLLLANGERTVEDMAVQSQNALEAVRLVVAKFKRAGMLEYVSPSMPQMEAPPPEPTVPEPIEEVEEEERPVRYWRGKRIQ